MEPLEKKINQLPPDLQKEVYDFVDFLELKGLNRKKSKLSLDWAGGLREFKNQFTSLELQKKVID